MKCQVCKQNIANTKLTRTINGRTEEMFVCSRCASIKEADFFGKNPFSVNTLFGGLFTQPMWKTNENTVYCETCGKSFNDIVSDGCVGCSDCYTTFFDQLLPSIQRIHGKTTHIGKSSNTHNEVSTPNNELARLKEELNAAVASQEYERCAEIRDRIKELEG